MRNTNDITTAIHAVNNQSLFIPQISITDTLLSQHLDSSFPQVQK